MNIEKDNNISFCTNCGEELKEAQNFCPKCGQKASAEFVQANTENQSDSVSITKNVRSKNKLIIGVAIIIAVIAIVIGSQGLYGDDKVAYDIIIACADNFKDPSSVRLVGGTVSSDKEMLFCTISAKNGFGSRGNNGYSFSREGWVMESGVESVLDKATDKLNIEKINKALDKHFNSFD